MKPGDQLEKKKKKLNVMSAVEFWDEKYNSINWETLHSYKKVPLDEIYSNFEKYCQRISQKNSLWLMKALRIISPISAFKPVLIHISDLDCIIKFDYITGDTSKVHEQAMISMKSESVNFLFQNSFGFDTLTVNGCFEEAQKGGFLQATRTLAIENLNNLGISVRVRTLFNFSIIKLFMTRLYRVARKLDV